MYNFVSNHGLFVSSSVLFYFFAFAGYGKFGVVDALCKLKANRACVGNFIFNVCVHVSVALEVATQAISFMC